MIYTKKTLILGLLLPIVVLAALVGFREYRVQTGTRVVLPITGYDPRSLISGHYLTYQVDYGIPGLCKEQIPNYVYVCLASKTFSNAPPKDCPTFIKGECQWGQFGAGVERFYVPEDKAAALEAQLRAGVASIELSVTPEGIAQVRELLIDGKSWREA